MRAGDPALTQPRIPGPQRPGFQPGVQRPTPPFAAQDQPLILRHASTAPERPCQSPRRPRPRPALGLRLGGPRPLRPGLAPLPRWQFQLPRGPSPAAFGVLPLFSPPLVLSSELPDSPDRITGPDIPLLLFSDSRDNILLSVQEDFARIGIIRFPKHQSWFSDTGACAGRLGAEPGLARAVDPASGAHYKAGREGTAHAFERLRAG